MSDQPDNTETTEVAVALHYSGKGAPRITAKGRGEVAARIREVAQEHAVPECQNADLVGLLERVELGEEIPEALFVAVAEVIAFAYSLSGGSPTASSDLQAGDHGAASLLGID